MKFLIVEDHALMREALGDLVREIDPAAVVLNAGTADRALELAAKTPDIDLLILDLLLPGQDRDDAFQTLTAMRQRHPGMRVVVYSAKPERETAQRAISLGAKGFIPKWIDSEEIVAALKLVLAGGTYRGPDAAPPGAHAPSPPPPAGSLSGSNKFTPRERDILARLDRPDKTISEECGIGVQNVRNRISAMLARLGLQNRRQLMIIAWEMGIEPAPPAKAKAPPAGGSGPRAPRGAAPRAASTH